MNDDDSHGKRRTGGASLALFVFQGVSETRCHFVGATVKTMAMAAGKSLLVPCSHSRWPNCPASGENGHPDRNRVFATGCPLAELWTAFDAFIASLDDEDGPE